MAELSLKSFQSLSGLLSPLYFKDLNPFPPTDPGEFGISKTLTLRANIVKCAKWGYIYNGSVLKCFPINFEDNKMRSKWVQKGQTPFVLNTSAYHFPNCLITCVTELSIHSSRSHGLTKLLVGLNCGSDSGAIVIFDPIIGAPIKWISTQLPVSSVIVLSNYEENGYTRPFFSEAMVAMVGIAAVGFHGGQLLIVDLGLDDPQLTTSSTLPFHSRKPFKLTCVEPHEDYVAPKRRAAAAQNLLICLDFKCQDFAVGYADYDSNAFYYTNPGNEVVKFAKDAVFVTCMEYVPAIGSLVLGFNFGGFQIWRIDKLQLEYSSTIHPNNVPVHSICFQLPVDDPKNFCYLWVLHGTTIQEMQSANAVFYALFYKRKEENEQFGFIYHKLHSCVPRLSFDLQDFYAPPENMSSSNLESSSSDGLTEPRLAVRPLRMWNQTENLVFFSWECERADVYMLGIFDLNQWYSAQTPGKLACVTDRQLNPFWAAIPITIPFGVKNHFIQLYDLQIIPKTLERWDNPHIKQEVHLFPASLSFQCICLSSVGTFTFEYLGVQEKLLRLIQKDGHQLLTEPAPLRQLCESFGVAPVLNITLEELGENDADRFFIFSALVESRRPSIIIQIANHWVDGSFANLDCTLDVILKWITMYNYTLKLHVEEHWTILATSRRDLPPETAHCLNYSNFVWNQLNGLVFTLERHEAVYDNPELSLDAMWLQRGLDRLVPYSAALLMMHRAGILPVNPDFDIMAVLKNMCTDRRCIVKDAVTNCTFLEPEHRAVRYLLIDCLMEKFNEAFVKTAWELEDGDFLYPPTHPIDIFNMFMDKWVNEDRRIVSRIVFYFILDITHLMDQPEIAGSLSTLRGDFSSILKLTPEEQNEVLHIWYIDHGEFDKALLFLFNGERIKDHDLLPWAEACVLLAAQGCKEPVQHILNHFCFPNAGKLYVNLLSENEPSAFDALTEILTSDLFVNHEELLFHCFDVATKKGLFDQFITTKSRHTPIRTQEILVKYLKRQPKCFLNDNRLLTFFMTRKDDKNAEEHFEKMKITWKESGNLNRKESERWQKTQSEMKSFINSCRGNFIMNFLGYDSGQAGIFRTAPLTVKTRMVPLTPSSDIIGNNEPRVKKLLKDQGDAISELYSPLTTYRRSLQKSSLDPNMSTETPPLSNKSFTNLSILLKTPKMNRRKSQITDEDEAIFSTPTGVHGILRSSTAPKVEEPDHTVRFRTEAEVVGTDISIELISSETVEKPVQSILEEKEEKTLPLTPRKSKRGRKRLRTDDEDEETATSLPVEAVAVISEEQHVSKVTPNANISLSEALFQAKAGSHRPTPIIEEGPEDMECSSLQESAVPDYIEDRTKSISSDLERIKNVMTNLTNIEEVEEPEGVSSISSDLGLQEQSVETEPEVPESSGRRIAVEPERHPEIESELPESSENEVEPERLQDQPKIQSEISERSENAVVPERTAVHSAEIPLEITKSSDSETKPERVQEIIASLPDVAPQDQQPQVTPGINLQDSPESTKSELEESKAHKSIDNFSMQLRTPKRERTKSRSPESKIQTTPAPATSTVVRKTSPRTKVSPAKVVPEVVITSGSNKKLSTSIDSNVTETPERISQENTEDSVGLLEKNIIVLSDVSGEISQETTEMSIDASMNLFIDSNKQQLLEVPSTPDSKKDTGVTTRGRHKSKSKTPEPSASVSFKEEEPLEERRITRSLSKKLGLEESIHNRSIEGSFLSTSKGVKRNLRARSEEVESPLVTTPTRRTRARSEAPGVSPPSKRRAPNKSSDSSEAPYQTVFDLTRPDPSVTLRRRKRMEKLDISDIEELELAPLATPTTSPRASTSKRRTRSGEKSQDDTVNTAVVVEAKFNIAEAVEQYDIKRERSSSPDKKTIVRRKERVFGYAPNLSMVAEASSNRAEDSLEEKSVLAATFFEEEKPKRRRVKKDKDDDSGDEAKSTTSSTRSGKSTRSTTSSTKSKKSTRSSKSAKK